MRSSVCINQYVMYHLRSGTILVAFDTTAWYRSYSKQYRRILDIGYRQSPVLLREKGALITEASCVMHSSVCWQHHYQVIYQILLVAPLLGHIPDFAASQYVMHPVRSCTLIVAVARNLSSFNLIFEETEELRMAEKSQSTPTMPEALRSENSPLEDKSKTVSLGKVDGKKQSKLFCLSHLSAAHTPWYCWSPLLEHLPWGFTWQSAAQSGAHIPVHN